MASDVQIANRALSKLGQERIISFADNTKAARAITSCYDDLRQAELRAYRWQFCYKRVALPALADAPAFGFTAAYQLPADYLRLDLVDDRYPSAMLDSYVDTDLAEYVLEGNTILTNIAAPLRIRYGADITDAAQWDPLFREMFACRLAVDLCETLTQSNTKGQQIRADYAEARRQAYRAGAIERPPASLPDGAWIIGRL